MTTDDDIPTTEQPTAATEEAPAADTALPPEPRTLMRSADDRLIAGVCGGIAERYGVDAGFVRILAVILALIGGVTIIVYLAAVLLLPQNDGTGNPIERVEYRRIAQLAGFGAIGVAVLMLLNGSVGSLGTAVLPALGVAACLAVIAAVVVVVGRRMRTPAPGESEAPALGRFLGWALIAIAALIGVVILAVASAAATAIFGIVPAAVAVLALGVVMVALSMSRRGVIWLALPALAIAAPATLLAAGDIRFDDSAGERTYAPVTEGAVLPLYKLGVGGVQVDLRRMRFPKDRPLVVRMDLGVGEARIVVPEGVCVASDSHIRGGQEYLLGSSWSGVALNEQRGQLDRWRGPKLLVEAEVDLGRLSVTGSSWDDDGGLERSFDDGWTTSGTRGEAITPAMAAAGCAGRVR